MRLLLAEDNLDLNESLLAFLQKEGFNVNLVSDGKAAQVFIESGLYSLAVLNLELPLKTGLGVLKNIRNKGIQTPIILLAAQDNLEDKIKGLDCGADDYLTKPFDLKEFAARIKAILRRSGSYSSGQKNLNEEIKFGEYVINSNSETLTKNDVVISLSKRETSLLLILVQNAGRIVTKTRILEEVYCKDKEIDTNTLEVHIHNLRRKINIPNFIQNIRRVGYFVQKDKVVK